MGLTPLALSILAISLPAFGRCIRRNTGVPNCSLRGLIKTLETAAHLEKIDLIYTEKLAVNTAIMTESEIARCARLKFIS